MRVLGLDLSSKTGWAIVEKDEAGTRLIESGLIELGKPILAHGPYPWCYLEAAQAQAWRIAELMARSAADIVVIEETNLGKNRYAQKFLEFLHCQVLDLQDDAGVGTGFKDKVVYISSSAWRKALELSLNAEDKRNNNKLGKAKRQAAELGKKLNKKALGIKGRINKKHLAVRFVNERYDLNLKMKDNDIADAICLATAYLAGAERCDGQ